MTVATITRRPGSARFAAIACVVCVAALAVAPMVFSQGDLRLIIEILTVFTFAQSWNLLAGYAGLMSFGQHLFIGLGSYFVFQVSNQTGINPFLLLPFSFLFSALAAAAISPLVFRLRDAYFAIGIWVLAEVARLFVSQTPWLGAVSGLPLIATREMDRTLVANANYWFAAALAVISVFGFYLLLRSKLGLALMAVRDNEQTAAAVGIDVWWTRFFGFVIGSGMCGMAGAAYYMATFHVEPGAAFDANWVVVMLFIVIIGGVGTIEGPIIGTAVYFLFRAWFSGTGNLYLMLLGAAAVLTMIFASKGIWGIVQQRFAIELLSVRRRPEAVAEPAAGMAEPAKDAA